MKKGRLLAWLIAIATGIFILAGTLWPDAAATSLSNGSRLLPSGPPWQTAADTLLREIARRDWGTAYSNLSNKATFSEQDFIRDLTGNYGSLRTYATLDHFDVSPLHASSDDAQLRARLYWSTIVGTFHEQRDLHVIRNDGRWQVEWPLVKEPTVPPQVLPVNYLRWDVIYRGADDDWGMQDVEAPHVRIVAMHPVDRSDGVSILGELLNEDVVPAFVNVRASLLASSGAAIATEDSFDKISHVLLPKAVTPFRIDFRSVHLAQVDSVRMQPSAILVPASADPVIEIESQTLHRAPEDSLTGDLVNQSGQPVSIAHVLGTFYDSQGNIVWVADDYATRALLPQSPVPFEMHVPRDLDNKVSSYRVVASSYSPDRYQ